MTRTVLFTAALASAAGLFALGAAAQQGQGLGQTLNQTPGATQAQAQNQVQARVQAQARIMTVAEIAARLEAEGYAVREIELERGTYEVEMTDRNGMRVKAYLNAVTGEVLPYGDTDRDRSRDRDGEAYDD